jgi:hypothetical protein
MLLLLLMLVQWLVWWGGVAAVLPAIVNCSLRWCVPQQCNGKPLDGVGNHKAKHPVRNQVNT